MEYEAYFSGRIADLVEVVSEVLFAKENNRLRFGLLGEIISRKDEPALETILKFLNKLYHMPHTGACTGNPGFLEVHGLIFVPTCSPRQGLSEKLNIKIGGPAFF